MSQTCAPQVDRKFATLGDALFSSDIVSENAHLEKLLQPWLTLLSWAEPLYKLFFSPLGDILYFDIGENQSHNQPDQETKLGFEFYFEPGFWEYGILLFSKIESLNNVLADIRITRNLSALVLF